MNIYTLLFKKKFGKIGIKQLIKYTVIPVMTIYIPAAAVAFSSNLFTVSDRYAAILLSAHAITDYDHWAPPIAFLGSYPAWTLYFNSRGLKTDYIFSATKKDFMRVLKDTKYQSVVLVGHGSYNCWRATDDRITNYDIETMQGKFKKKNGEWFQLSCSDRDYSEVQLGELVMENGTAYYYKDRSVGDVDLVLDALTAFSHIKADYWAGDAPERFTY